MIKNIIVNYFIWIMPILLGLSNRYFPYEKFATELMPWLIKGAIFIGLISILLGKEFYNIHIINFYSCRFSSVLIWIAIYFIIGGCLFGTNARSLQLAATSMIFNPILEELLSRGFLCNIRHYSKVKTGLFVLLSTSCFSFSHWFNDHNILELLTITDHFFRFLAHFYFGLTLAIITLYSKRIDFVILLHMFYNSMWWLQSI